MKPILVPLLASLVCVTVHAADPILLEAPAETKKADLDACAAMMNKRIAALALKDLKATVVQKDGKSSVEVASPRDVADDAFKKIRILALFAGKAGGVRFPHVNTKEEEAECEWPTLTTPGKPPKGFQFFRMMRPDFAVFDEFRVRNDPPFATWSDVSVKTRAADKWTFQFAPAASKRLVAEVDKNFDAAHSSYSGFCFTVDDKGFPDQIEVHLKTQQVPLKNAEFTMPAEQAALMEAILRNPMPLSLKPPAAR
ncbi:MAG: hypothetical protein AAB074_04275 [Planctomycetota bacterium]